MVAYIAAADLPTNVAVVAARYDPKTGAKLNALAHALPEALAWELLELISRVDADVHRSCIAAEEQAWARLLAHALRSSPDLTAARESSPSTPLR